MANAAITVDLNARIAQFETDLKRASSSLDGFAKKGTSALSGLKSIGAGLVGALSVGAIVSFAKAGIDAADSLNDMSQRLGVSVKDLASFKLAAEQSGTSLDGVGAGIARLTRSIGEAEGGNKKLASALGELGITARDPKEAFFQLADAVQRIDDPSKRAALLSQVLGKSYQDLVPLLAQGGDELRKSALASESFADAMARLAPDADKFNDQLALLKQNAATAAASGLIPLVEALNRVFERYEKIARLRDAGASITEILTGGISANTAGGLKSVNEQIADIEENITRLRKNSGGMDQSIIPLEADLARLKTLRTELQKLEVERMMTPPSSGASQPRIGGGVVDISAANATTRATKTARTPSDPLSNLLGSTDIGRTREYDRLLGLLDARFAGGKKNAELYAQAVAKLNEQFGKGSIDPLGSGSFKTTSKETADFIREQQDAINGLNSEMAQDGVQSAQAFDSALQALISDTTIAKTAALQEQVSILDKALFDGAIGADQHAEAMKKLTDGLPEKLKETNDFAKDLGLTFASAFEKAVVGGEKFSDVLKGLAQDIAQMLIRQNVTTPIANAVGSINWGSILGSAFATGGVMTSNGPMQLNAYAGGGVASTPQVALFGEGSMNEAFVPLPDGKRIPVSMKNGGGSTVINMNISTPDANSFRASSGQIAAQMTRALQRGRRFT